MLQGIAQGRLEAPPATHPAEEDALEQGRIQPVRLGPPVLAGDGDARWMDDISFNATGPQPARQPEAVAPGLESHGDTADRAPGFGRLALPALQQSEEHRLIRIEPLQRVPLEPRNDAGHEPARLAHLDARNKRALLIQGGVRSVRSVWL